MTGRQRMQLVEERADLILASKPDEHEFVVHFESQMRRGKIRRLLYTHFVRTGAIYAGLDPQDI
jgi:hypothetical protein